MEKEKEEPQPTAKKKEEKQAEGKEEEKQAEGKEEARQATKKKEEKSKKKKGAESEGVRKSDRLKKKSEEREQAERKEEGRCEEEQTEKEAEAQEKETAEETQETRKETEEEKENPPAERRTEEGSHSTRTPASIPRSCDKEVHVQFLDMGSEEREVFLGDIHSKKEGRGGTKVGPPRRREEEGRRTAQRKPYRYEPSQIVQCYKCYNFGHFAGQCRNKTRCPFCGWNHHEKYCSTKNRPRCCNCRGHHPAFVARCPARKRLEEERKQRQEPRRPVPREERRQPAGMVNRVRSQPQRFVRPQVTYAQAVRGRPTEERRKEGPTSQRQQRQPPAAAKRKDPPKEARRPASERRKETAREEKRERPAPEHADSGSRGADVYDKAWLSNRFSTLSDLLLDTATAMVVDMKFQRAEVHHMLILANKFCMEADRQAEEADHHGC